MTPRPFEPEDIPALARIWHDGWHEAHAAHVPQHLTSLRTLDSFATRLATMQDRTRVIGPVGAPLGLCAIEAGELDQLFVGLAGRGTGAATTLLQDAEARLAANGVGRAHLFCLPQNDHAARFYARHGWEDMGLFKMEPPATGQAIDLTCIRFEKTV